MIRKENLLPICNPKNKFITDSRSEKKMYNRFGTGKVNLEILTL